MKQEQSLNAQKNDTFEFKLKRGRWTLYLQNSKTWVRTGDNMKFYVCKFYIRQIENRFYIYEEELLDVTFQVTGASYFSNYANAAISLEQLNNAKVQKEGHVHAELMLEYAKDSTTDSEAWKEWQYKDTCMTTWGATSGIPVWNTNTKYRRKPVMFGILKALESYRLGFKVTREGPAHSMISFNQADLDSTDWYIVN